MRQIDADALRERMYHDAFEMDSDMQKWDGGCWIRYKMFENAIDDAPTVEPQQWIPVTKRLPEELKEVNVTWVNTDPEQYYEYIKDVPFTGSAVYYKGRWFWYSAVCVDYLREYGLSPNDEMDDAIKVLAWMPLPEPYQEV